MKITNIQAAWQQQESKLEATRKLNLEALKELKLEKTGSKVKQLLFLPITTLLFFTFIACYGIYFFIQHWGIWYFAFSGGVVTFFSMAFIVSSVRQLGVILQLDYRQPVVNVQRQLSVVKISVLKNLKIAAAVLPFSPFVGLLVIKAIFNYNITQLISIEQLGIFAIVTLILQILALFISNKLNIKNSNKKYINWLLKGNGSQIDEAQQLLKEIESFEKKGTSM